MGRLRENIRRAKDIIAANRNISISEYENHVAEGTRLVIPNLK